MGVCEAGEGGAGVAQYGRAALPREGRSDAKVGLGSPHSLMNTRALWKALSQLSQRILQTTLLGGETRLKSHYFSFKKGAAKCASAVSRKTPFSHLRSLTAAKGPRLPA